MTPVTVDPYYVPPDPPDEVEVEVTEASQRRDYIRLLIGDDESLLSDNELDVLLNKRGVLDSSGETVYNPLAAAADAAGAIAAKYARHFSFSEDGQSFEVSQRVGHYQALERTLRARAGGISVPLRLAGTETT